MLYDRNLIKTQVRDLKNLQFDQLKVLEELPGERCKWVLGQISVREDKQ